MRLFTRAAAALAVAALTSVGLLAPTVTATAAPALADTSCSGVWVVVVGQGTQCATSHSTGKQALQSAGFSVRDKSAGFLCQINGSPGTCTITPDAFWSYWHASRNADGSWGPWVFSQLGYANRKPQAGDAEGWVFGNGKTQPPSPPTMKASAPATTSAPAKQTSTSKPTSPAKPAEQAKPTAPARTTDAARPAAPGAAPSSNDNVLVLPSMPTQTPEPTAAELPSPSAEPVPSQTPPAVAPEPASGTDDGATGVLVTVGLLAAGGAALGGWWFVKRRNA